MEDSHQYEKKICRLCLMKCDKYKVIERNLRNNVHIILLKINLLLSEEPVICKDCTERVKNCLYFKTMCLDTHKYIISFISNKTDIKIDLKDIYLSKKGYATGVLKDSNICGFCMGLVKSCFAIPLENEENMLQIMFEKCFPELDFSIVNKPIICEPCHGHLQDYFNFVTNCLLVEEEIGKYCGTLGIKNNQTLIDLTDVLQFTLRNKVTKGENVNTIDKNKEEKHSVHPERFNEVGEHENENITEVDDQKLKNVPQFLLRDITLDIIGTVASKIELQGKFCDGSENIVEEHEEIKQDPETITIENYKYDNKPFSSRTMLEDVDANKKVGKFVEGQVVQKIGNYMEVEDQKYLVNDEIEIKTDPHDFSSFQSDSSKLVTSDDSLKDRKYSELDHHSPPSEALICEAGREYRNDVVKQESTSEDPLVRTLHSECKNPSRGQMLTTKHISGRSIYQCESCSFQTKYKRNLAKHSCMVHDDTGYRCESCSFQTKHKARLKKHSLVHKVPSEAIMYKCESCPFQTKRKGVLKRHLLIHKDSFRAKMYQCELCSYKTKRIGNFKKHLLVHKDPSKLTMYQCDSCPFQTKLKGNLKTHSLVHKDPSKLTMYLCNLCPFQTKYKYSLESHSLVHVDPLKVTMYQCKSCPYQTKRLGSLKEHSFTHMDLSKVTMYQCQYCLYQAKHKCHLELHLLVHKDPLRVPMHKCELCLFQSKHKRSLRKHLLIHKDPLQVTMHQCNSCPFQTNRKDGLKKHLLVHMDTSNVIIYRCESCQFQTKRKSDLRRHLLVHKDPLRVTMYKCQLCPFQTKRKDYLKKHSLVHKDPSEVTMYRCETCSFQTKVKGTLKKHSLIHTRSFKGNKT